MASTEDQFQNLDATAQASVPAAGAEAPPADDTAPPKRARRATKKAAAPAPVEPSSAAEPATGPADDSETGVPARSDDLPEAPVKAAVKRAAKKAAEKTTKKATGTRTATKTATKKAVAKKAAAAESAGDAQSPGAEGAEEAGAAGPARRNARTTAKAAKKGARATASQPADAPADPRLDDAGPSTGAAVVDPTAELDDEALDQPATEPAAAEAETAGSGTVPSFGLLFQAPDPAAATPRRRRGRATAPAGEPQPRADRSEDLGTGDVPTDQAEDRGQAVEEVPAQLPDADEAPGDDRADTAQPGETGDAGDAGEAGEAGEGRRRRRRGGKGRGRGRGAAVEDGPSDATGAATAVEQSTGDSGPADDQATDEAEDEGGPTRRRRRRRRSGSSAEGDDPPGTVTKVREARRDRDEPQSVKGSTRLEAKKQRRREGREAGRRRTVITEAEFLARRESVERVMVVREREGRTQIGVLEDDVLVEHYVSRETNASMAGNVYLGRVQNVLPSMEAAFVDIGKGRNAVLYAGEVNWDAAGLEGNQPKRIENALKSGDTVLVQVTKDPIGHKGARLTSQISLPGRYLVYVPEGSMTGISRKLPDTERARLKAILKEVVPDSAGVIVRTAAEGASEEELRADVERLTRTWDTIRSKAESKGKAKGGAPALVHGEPDLTVRVIRDVFNEDFTKLVVAGETAYAEVSDYLGDVAPDLAERLEKWTGTEDLFTRYRVDEQIAKAMDRKVWLPSGGSLVIDRTEAMTVVDVNTGKFVGSGGNLEETVTKNNIEAAEEIVRQLRLRDIGGIIVIDFIDMVLESNRDLVVRRLLECLGRDRTKHQVAEVTSLGLVQMTRKRVGSGLIEVFSETCERCGGRGIIVHADPVEKPSPGGADSGGNGGGGAAPARGRGRRGKGGAAQPEPVAQPVHAGPTPAQIAAAAHAAALKSSQHDDEVDAGEPTQTEPVPATPEPAGQQDAAPEQQPAPTPVAEPAAQPAAQPAAEPVAGPVAEPVAAAPRRRKRGRVVAPAGPPRAATDGGTATAVADGAATATGEG